MRPSARSRHSTTSSRAAAVGSHGNSRRAQPPRLLRQHISRLRARARQLWLRSHTRWRRRVHVRAASAAIAARAMRFVWVNTKSRVYDFEGPENYRHTTRRAYMCETDAMAAGARAAMNEKHP
jgi:hypothetical protein